MRDNKSEVVGDSYVGFDETHLHPSWDDTLRNPRRPSQSQAYTSTAFHFPGQGTEIVLQMPTVNTVRKYVKELVVSSKSREGRT
ncbi:uncharacterized protein TRAVEDRAFT_51028 [Trametes versicolor FP-101664 SS1]|uniref:uncharacterized protein n=1 Tax=Trametes versicolor (strain FP-101664) TaxID=717944 RepID=UPI0004624561|nr:uncharacterized protein TRAVEDRAFT_51028 [Trametes versicolor FP-101664 SS1]EIW54892.1 hypothetical protein TRAVEDRAFT_51028 [Trametes versicolor FP-101664 SS1]